MSKRRSAVGATPEPARKRQRNHVRRFVFHSQILARPSVQSWSSIEHLTKQKDEDILMFAPRLIQAVLEDDTFYPDEETVESTQELGEKVLSLLKRSTDKNGRLISTEFLDLPDRKQYPDYYETILLPLSLNSIESKLNNGKYATMSQMESDLKRMISNAKEYNSNKSAIYEDAERMRKTLSSFMPKHNPAYQDSDYRAVPTPLPGHLGGDTPRESSLSGSEHPAIKLKLTTNATNRSAAPSELAQDEEDLSEEFLTLLDSLSAQEDAINFEKKPPRRDLPHYYKVIEHPTSISDVRAMIQQSKVATWDEFARKTRLIWSNAKEYNEPESVIYNMTIKLEAWLEEQLQEHGVPPKVIPRLSLKTATQPRQLKLKMATPPSTSTNVSTYTVDHAALERQRREMSSALSRARDASQPASTPAPTVHSAIRRSVSAVAPDIPASRPVDIQGQRSIESPASNSVPADIPTPTTEGVPPDHANATQTHVAAAPLTNGYHSGTPQPAVLTNGHTEESTNPMDRKFRDATKSAADALIQSVTYMTNPLMASDPRWRLVRRASPSKTQTSYYTYLPASHSSIRVIPELHADLRAGKRKYKVFVLNNGATLPASPDVAGQGVYDLHLVPGENIVMVEAISTLKPGERKAYARDWEQFDFERVTFYIYLRPQTT